MTQRDMAGPLRALADDLGDLIASLHLLAAAAVERGDADARGALRLLARYAESIGEHIDRLRVDAEVAP